MTPQQQSNRRQVSLRMSSWQKAVDLRERIVQRTGRVVPITDVLDQALDSLATDLDRTPSPEEATSQARERFINAMVELTKANPDASINYENGEWTVRDRGAANR